MHIATIVLSCLSYENWLVEYQLAKEASRSQYDSYGSL